MLFPLTFLYGNSGPIKETFLGIQVVFTARFHFLAVPLGGIATVNDSYFFFLHLAEQYFVWPFGILALHSGHRSYIGKLSLCLLAQR